MTMFGCTSTHEVQVSRLLDHAFSIDTFITELDNDGCVTFSIGEHIIVRCIACCNVVLHCNERCTLSSRLSAPCCINFKFVEDKTQTRVTRRASFKFDIKKVKVIGSQSIKVDFTYILMRS